MLSVHIPQLESNDRINLERKVLKQMSYNMDSPCRKRCSLDRNAYFRLLRECNINLYCVNHWYFVNLVATIGITQINTESEIRSKVT